MLVSWRCFDPTAAASGSWCVWSDLRLVPNYQRASWRSSKRADTHRGEHVPVEGEVNLTMCTSLSPMASPTCTGTRNARVRFPQQTSFNLSHDIFLEQARCVSNALLFMANKDCPLPAVRGDGPHPPCRGLDIVCVRNLTPPRIMVFLALERLVGLSRWSPTEKLVPRESHARHLRRKGPDCLGQGRRRAKH